MSIKFYTIKDIKRVSTQNHSITNSPKTETLPYLYILLYKHQQSPSKTIYPNKTPQIFQSSIPKVMMYAPPHTQALTAMFWLGA